MFKNNFIGAKQKLIKGKKRILKRVYHNSIDGQSGYSSLESDYVDISNHDVDWSLSRIVEDNDEDDMQNVKIPTVENEYSPIPSSSPNKPFHKKSESDKSSDSPSLPADEDYDSKANLKLDRNPPRKSLKVFEVSLHQFFKSKFAIDSQSSLLFF